jgi:hypothetical protein
MNLKAAINKDEELMTSVMQTYFSQVAPAHQMPHHFVVLYIPMLFLMIGESANTIQAR